MNDQNEDGRPPATEPEAPPDPPAAGEPVATSDAVEGDGTGDPLPPLDIEDDRPAAGDETEGVSAGQRIADAVRTDLRRGLQDETAPERVEGVFVCVAPIGEDICGCNTFTRGAVVGLTQGGDEAGVVYACRGCSAHYRFEGEPVPSWKAQL